MVEETFPFPVGDFGLAFERVAVDVVPEDAGEGRDGVASFEAIGWVVILHGPGFVPAGADAFW